MRKFKIVTDVTCDLCQEMVDQLPIDVVEMNIELEGRTITHYSDERECSSKDFYESLRNGHMASTSQITPAKFIDVFTRYAQAEMDVLYIAFSSGLSGTYNSACIAKEEVLETNPMMRINVVDSKAASGGEGLIVYLAAKMQEAGASMDEVTQWIESNKDHVNHWFTVDDLAFLKRGGRINTATMLVGSMLKIKPVMNVSEEGKLTPKYNARGRKKSLHALANECVQRLETARSDVAMISHGDCEADALYLKDEILKNSEIKEVMLTSIGPVIGSHSGPGTVALFFLGKHKDVELKNEQA